MILSSDGVWGLPGFNEIGFRGVWRIGSALGIRGCFCVGLWIIITSTSNSSYPA